MTLKQIADNFGGRVWQKAGKSRIYFDTDKTATAYIDYDDDLGDDFVAGMEGGTLRVFSNCQNQSFAWNINRAKQIKHELMVRIASFTGDKVCETWQEVIL